MKVGHCNSRDSHFHYFHCIYHLHYPHYLHLYHILPVEVALGTEMEKPMEMDKEQSLSRYFR